MDIMNLSSQNDFLSGTLQTHHRLPGQNKHN